jgi:hypothetical protein
MKRTTVHIFGAGDFAVALSLCRFLKHRDVDAVVVGKHAVQVHPDDERKAAAAMPAYKWGWDRPEAKCPR